MLARRHLAFALLLASLLLADPLRATISNYQDWW